MTKLCLPQTSWSLIRRAGRGGSEAIAAREEFAARYYQPVRAYVGAIVRDPQAVDDVVQGFFADQVFGGRILDRADSSRGMFRNYLKQSIRHYVWDWRAKLKRIEDPLFHPDGTEAGWNIIQDEVIDPDRAYHLSYVNVLIKTAMEAVRAICEERNQQLHFRIFYRYYIADPAPGSWEQVAEEFQLRDGRTARHRADTVLEHFRRVLRESLAEELGSADAVEEELDHLLALL